MRGQMPKWSLVKSEGHQGSALGPLLFTMYYINDIHDNIASHILKFADNTKIFSKVATQEKIHHLQEDLNKLCHWSEE